MTFALSARRLARPQYCAMQVWLRCGKDRVWQFVDLLAVTNISCILLEERHFGFYLHGRSVTAALRFFLVLSIPSDSFRLNCLDLIPAITP